MQPSDSATVRLLLKYRYGLFAFGYYGIGFEISVEATYPIDEGNSKINSYDKKSNGLNYLYAI